MGLQALELVRLAEEREHGVRDEAHRRLVSGDDEEHRHAVQLVLAQALAMLLRLHERAHEVVGRLGAPLREEHVEVGDELVGMPQELLAQLVRHRREQKAVRPYAEAISILGRDAEQLGDHRDRKREREVVHELHAAFGSDSVDEVVGDLLDPRSQALDHARRKRLRHELSQATVAVRRPSSGGSC